MHPAFRNDINRNAVALQMRYCYVPAPYSIYQGIGFGNTYLVTTPEGNVVIDTSSPQRAPQHPGGEVRLARRQLAGRLWP